MASIPIELWDEVASLLDDDPSSLRSLALTGPRFIAPAQRRLFARIRIVYRRRNATKSSDITISRFEDILSFSPHLATYVQTLTIAFSDSNFQSRREHSAMVSLLPSFQRVEQFCLSGMDQIHGLVFPTAAGLPGYVVTALRQFLCNTPTLRQCKLHYMTETPTSILVPLLSVPSVAFDWVSSSAQSESLDSSLAWASTLPINPRLHTLDMSGGGESLAAFVNILVSSEGRKHSRRIRNLTLEAGSNPNYAQLLLVCSEDLQRLQLGIPKDSFVATISPLPLLSVLELKLPVDSHGHFSPKLRAHIATIVPVTPRLETLKLLFQVFSPYLEKFWQRNGGDVVAWAPFGLDFPERCPSSLLSHLKCVDCILTITGSERSQRASSHSTKFSDLMQGYMPGIALAPNHLKFTCSVRSD